MIPKSDPKTWSIARVKLMKNQYKECDVSLVCQNEKTLSIIFPMEINCMNFSFKTSAKAGNFPFTVKMTSTKF